MAVAKIDAGQKNVLPFETRVERFELEERREHQSRADDKQERQSDLQNDQCFAEAEFRAWFFR